MLSKFPAYYIQRFVILLMSGLVIVAGIMTFGNNSEVFDRIFLVSLFGLIIYFYSDKNIVSIFVIIAVGRLYEEIIFILPTQEYLFAFAIYLFSFWVFYKFRYDHLSKFCMILLVSICVAEIYWWKANYESRPDLAWYVVLLLQDIVIRHFIFMRPAIFKSWSKNMVSLPLDLQLYNLLGFFAILVNILVFEYFLRHIFNVPSLAIYKVYPYFVHAGACFMLWLILNYALKRTSLFNA
jgi:hypothetical protein